MCCYDIRMKVMDESFASLTYGRNCMSNVFMLSKLQGWLIFQQSAAQSRDTILRTIYPVLLMPTDFGSLTASLETELAEEESAFPLTPSRHSSKTHSKLETFCTSAFYGLSAGNFQAWLRAFRSRSKS